MAPIGIAKKTSHIGSSRLESDVMAHRVIALDLRNGTHQQHDGKTQASQGRNAACSQLRTSPQMANQKVAADMISRAAPLRRGSGRMPRPPESEPPLRPRRRCGPKNARPALSHSMITTAPRNITVAIAVRGPVSNRTQPFGRGGRVVLPPHLVVNQLPTPH